ncbi:RecB family exonuclease [Geodermatophilus sp. SYSU D00700]
MTTEGARFDTDVPGIWGHWPTTPALWSYSSLKEIEVCPRRWMLSHATYPDLWGRRGYPSLPVVAAIFGNVVHGVVERLAQALADASIEAATPGAVISVLGDQGGWRGIVMREIEHQLARFDDNPRVSAERIDRVREELIRRAPQAADQVKVFLGREALPAGRGSSTAEASTWGTGKPSRLPAAPGTHAEREVCADTLRLTGRIDLLVIDDADVTVVDFKTGEEDTGHDDQVRLYALLWSLDDQTNPEGRPATKLEVAYPSRTRFVEPLDQAGLNALESSTAARIAVADAITEEVAPTATPSPEGCQFCQVKHLCDVYWSTIPPAVSETTTEEWFDFEGRVLRPHGTRSWYLEAANATVEVLVRTVETNVPFPQGARVRLLGVRRTIDPDEQDRLVISMVSTSEWYAASS